MISCEEHDYVEIACSFHYPVKLTLRSGEIIAGVALDTQFDINREECIKLNGNGEDRLIVLDTVAAIEVCVENPHFHTTLFDAV